MSRGTRARERERGSAMLVTMILIASMLAGASVLVALQVSSTRSVGLSRASTHALFCAEAGLAAARRVVVTNKDNWNTALAAVAQGNTSEPTWLASGIGSHDLNGDGTADFTAYIRDNVDDCASGCGSTDLGNAAVNSDDQVFVVVSCTQFAETPKQVTELVNYRSPPPCMREQLGGGDSNGNFNDGC